MVRPSTRMMVLGLIVVSAAATAAGTASRMLRTPADPLRIVLNDMVRPAGSLTDGVLTLALEARAGEWRPEGEAGPALPVAAFAEAGRAMQNPGPLIRVPAGTQVRASVRNALAEPLTVYGLGAQRGVAADSAVIAPGATHEFRFKAAEPGIHYYAGRTTPGVPLTERAEFDSQLNGAIVVDPADASDRPDDRIFVISWRFTLDSTTVSGLGRNALMAINGASWPHTQRFDVTQGDSLHWRWINMTAAPHPMHLHGFYFRVDAEGDGARHTPVPAAQRRDAVTHLLLPGATLDLTWSPNRPGNWIFHCHFAGHMATEAALNQDRRYPAPTAAHDHDASLAAGPSAAEPTAATAHANHQMAGLVIGIRVRARGRAPDAAGEARALRLLMRSKPNVYGEYAGYGFVLGGSAEEVEPTAFSVPGPLLVLQKDQPVAITLVNQSHEPAAVHWHGIELESYPDGVPGWSGAGRRLLPTIPPGDSLTVRFTPPRAGTFMYHSHFNELQQIGSGMYGGIVVLEPGTTFDPATDRVLLFSDNGPTVNLIRGPFPAILLNGSERPAPFELRAGVTTRLRLINIGAESLVAVSLLDGEQPVEWRMVAKDGARVPDALAVATPAQLMFASGEIYDFEVTPARSGSLTLRFGVPPLFPDVPPPVDVTVLVKSSDGG